MSIINRGINRIDNDNSSYKAKYNSNYSFYSYYFFKKKTAKILANNGAVNAKEATSANGVILNE